MAPPVGDTSQSSASAGSAHARVLNVHDSIRCPSEAKTAPPPPTAEQSVNDEELMDRMIVCEPSLFVRNSSVSLETSAIVAIIAPPFSSFDESLTMRQSVMVILTEMLQ